MSADRMLFVEEFGKRDPVKWFLDEPDGRSSSGRVANGEIIGGKCDGLQVSPGGGSEA